MVDRRRTNSEIIYDFLNCLIEKKGTVKLTRVMYKVNLSHMLLKKYLNLLSENGFIKVNTTATKSGKRQTHQITLTEQGMDFYNKIRNHVNQQEKLMEVLYGKKSIM